MPQIQRPVATAAERRGLRQIYLSGGLTPAEAWHLFSHLNELQDRDLIHVTRTAMGELIVLTHQGLLAIPEEGFTPRSLTRSIDLAYERLCLAELEWPVLKPAVRHGATGGSGLARYPLVQTPDGDAYVLAQLSRGGVSSLTIRRIAERHRSSLNLTRTSFVIITPSPRKGRQTVRRNRAYMRYVHCLPLTRDDLPPGRLETVREREDLWEDTPLDDAPVLTSVGVERARQRGVPDLTLEILQLARPARIERAKAALACDGVITSGQLERHFGLTDRDFPETPFVEDLVRPVHTRYGLEVTARFFLADARMQRMEVPQLGHRAGTAELRHTLGIAPEQCEVEPRSDGRLVRRAEEPDAIWYPDPADRSRRWAVEYDTGSYTKTVVEQKRDTFYRRFERIIWGVPSPRRAQFIRSHISDSSRSDVRVVNWWEAEGV
ncbi:hypothetical protein [Deinococcus soli (ex Cha et al. 2016)]|uniref:hypothetical protein n=1 Tax=Deinococcus soli (ex Cha et al. 2016) TaxID=1309411 RepID=UPI00166AA6D8|nr:hypothetical protein [Deinococcus soli (ex Cha et al. 2016)]GGB73883.1 hypothetical protein GCM10008019_32610 [Deinococcus soli (ex Cha et al. 2016)]